MKKLILIWLLGLFTVVPLAIYHLLFNAEAGRLALSFCVVLWVFGYWVCAIPLYKLYQVRKAYQRIRSREDLLAFIDSGNTKDLAVSTISSDSGIPEFIVSRVYDQLARRANR